MAISDYSTSSDDLSLSTEPQLPAVDGNDRVNGQRKAYSLYMEYRTWPEGAGNLRRCLACEEAFVEGDDWLCLTACQAGYPETITVGLHERCYLAT